MNKKSQAAMEFLMMYGWAILIVLIALGALWYFGVLNPDYFGVLNPDYIPNYCSCNYVNYEGWNTVNIDNITYYECYNVTKSLNFETQKIDFESTSKLFYCDDEIKQLIEVE